MLEALHPGRIDLGIGRAPAPTRSRRTRCAGPLDPSADDLPTQLARAARVLRGTFPQITAVPGAGNSRRSGCSARATSARRLAGELGLPFSFAHHFMPQNTEAALEIYRRSFRPSPALEEPYAMIGVAVVCAETDERARWLHGPAKLSFLRLRRAGRRTLPSPEEAAAYEYSPDQSASSSRAGPPPHIVGSPDTVRADLLELRERTKAPTS